MKALGGLWSVFALLGVVLVVSGVAVADSGPQRQVTRGDPFASCPAPVDDFGGVVFPSTEPEVWLAANPADPSNLIGSIQQDRWSDGGAQGLVAPYSTDGGRSWNETPLPFTVCASSYYSGKVLRDPFTGRPYDRASDPWVDIGPDGTAYAVTISFDANDNGGSIGAATSSDGGRTWHNQQNILAENAHDPSLPFNDKESDAADPVHAGTAYAVWDRLQNIPCPPGVPPASGNSDDRVFRQGGAAPAAAATTATAAALDCFDGPGTLSRTTNFGRTWSTPTTIVPTPANEQTIGNEIVVDPNTGTVYDFYMYVHADDSLTIEDVASHDRGKTWGPRQLVSDSQTVGVVDPATGAPLRTGDIIPQAAVDPRSGRLYVVWQDSRANSTDPNQDALFISTSTRGGLTGTWSAPSVVNDPGDEAAFTAAVKVLGTGSVAIEYYALGNQTGNGRWAPARPAGVLPARPAGPQKTKAGVLRTSIVLRVTDGPGTTFTRPEQAIGDDFNMLAAPFASGFFTGDYEGLAVDVRDTRRVHGFFTATNCLTTKCAAVQGFDEAGDPIPSNAPNPTDVFSPDLRAG